MLFAPRILFWSLVLFSSLMVYVIKILITVVLVDVWREGNETRVRSACDLSKDSPRDLKVARPRLLAWLGFFPSIYQPACSLLCEMPVFLYGTGSFSDRSLGVLA